MCQQQQPRLKYIDKSGSETRTAIHLLKSRVIYFRRTRTFFKLTKSARDSQTVAKITLARIKWFFFENSCGRMLGWFVYERKSLANFKWHRTASK